MSGPSPSSPFESASEQSSSSSTSSASTPQNDPQETLKQVFGTLCKQQLIGEVDKLKATLQKDNPDPQEVIMSIPMLLALTICPAMLGTQEAIRQSQSKSKREEHRSRRCNLVVSCVKPSIRSRDINNKLVVLKDNKLYIANEHPLYNHDPKNNVSKGYAFSGYFLPYPDASYEGIVSTISDNPPMLNWIYVDKKTYEVKYGVRADAQPNITGPFDCTRQDRRLMVEGWEGFCAVEELPGIWALYYDRDDDGLKTKVPMGTRVLEVELTRREKKEPKPERDEKAATTIDEKWKEHKAQTEQEEKDREIFLAAEAEAAAIPTERGPEPAKAEEPKLEELSEAIRRLGFNTGNIAPSVVPTDLASVWSATRNKEGDGSETVPSSGSEGGNDGGSVNGSDAGSYKKPQVEDAHDEVAAQKAA